MTALLLAEAPPADLTPEFQQMLGDIVALKITATKVLAKEKLSQNRDIRDYLRAVERLRASGHGNMADRMENRMVEDR